MNFNQKKKMTALLNKGQYEQAVNLLQNEKVWDSQDIEIFVDGFDLKQYALCNVIKNRLLNFEGYKMPWRSALKLEMLKIKLSNNSS